MIKLISEEVLQKSSKTIRGFIKRHPRNWAVDIDEPVIGKTFGNYVLFLEKELLEAVGLSGLTELELFYNKYYYFALFVKTYQHYYAPDAGLEQQAFCLLEEAPEDVDWNEVAKIDAAIESDFLKE